MKLKLSLSQEIPENVDESQDKEMEALDREYAQLRQEEEYALQLHFKLVKCFPFHLNCTRCLLLSFH